jgi:hypothetical protein
MFLNQTRQVQILKQKINQTLFHKSQITHNININININNQKWQPKQPEMATKTTSDSQCQQARQARAAQGRER